LWKSRRLRGFKCSGERQFEVELLDETSVGFSDKSSGGRKPKIYNLDMILSVGYRVNSKRLVVIPSFFLHRTVISKEIAVLFVIVLNCAFLIG